MQSTEPLVVRKSERMATRQKKREQEQKKKREQEQKEAEAEKKRMEAELEEEERRQMEEEEEERRILSERKRRREWERKQVKRSISKLSIQVNSWLNITKPVVKDERRMQIQTSRACLTVRITVKNGDPPEHGKIWEN